MAEHPSLHVHLLVTTGGGSVQRQWAVRVERMAHVGQVQEKGQTVEVEVIVGQTAAVGPPGTIEVISCA